MIFILAVLLEASIVMLGWSVEVTTISNVWLPSTKSSSTARTVTQSVGEVFSC